MLDELKQIRETLAHYAQQGSFLRHGSVCDDSGRAKQALPLVDTLIEREEAAPAPSQDRVEDSLARLIARQHGQDPDGVFYPLSGNRSVQWPIWQAYRDYAKEILAALQPTKAPEEGA